MAQILELLSDQWE